MQVRVSVRNASPLLPSTLKGAEQVAGRVFQRAGIEILWVSCGVGVADEPSAIGCSEVSFPSHLHLQIISASRDLSRSAVGAAFLGKENGGCYADLFYEPIHRLQEVSNVSPAVVLGHAIAHELGHLLLGSNSHSPRGLMRGHWTRHDLEDASKGRLGFSSEQCLRIAARLERGETDTR